MPSARFGPKSPAQPSPKYASRPSTSFCALKKIERVREARTAARGAMFSRTPYTAHAALAPASSWKKVRPAGDGHGIRPRTPPQQWTRPSPITLPDGASSAVQLYGTPPDASPSSRMPHVNSSPADRCVNTEDGAPLTCSTSLAPQQCASLSLLRSPHTWRAPAASCRKPLLPLGTHSPPYPCSCPAALSPQHRTPFALVFMMAQKKLPPAATACAVAVPPPPRTTGSTSRCFTHSTLVSVDVWWSVSELTVVLPGLLQSPPLLLGLQSSTRQKEPSPATAIGLLNARAPKWARLLPAS